MGDRDSFGGPVQPGPPVDHGAGVPAAPGRDRRRHRGATTRLLGPAGHRKPPHIYSDAELADLLQAAAGLPPADGLRSCCYVTLFGLLACTGLRISEALALTCVDVDLTDGVLTVRAGKRGRTRLVPLHATTIAPLLDYAVRREQHAGTASGNEAFFRTDRAEQISYRTALHTFDRLIPYGGWFVKGGRGFGLRACTGPAPPASRVLRIAARRPAAALDPGASAGPWQAGIGQAGGLPEGCAQPDPAAVWG